MEKLAEVKVFRDPIYTYIYVKDRIVWDLINTKPMQRLRRIHQLGGTFQAFPSAEHTRFGHALGVYEMARLLIETVPDLQEALNEREQLLVKCAALLHDIGHGPFSHAMETLFQMDHEALSVQLILDQSGEIYPLLQKIDATFAADVAAIIAKKYPRELLVQLVSSQLDADRMDYLRRDAYFSGVPYGNFDPVRILRVMRVVEDRVVFKESGMHAIENYIMSRYHMYWQIYFHPIGRSYELVLAALVNRLRTLRTEGYQFQVEPTLIFALMDQGQKIDLATYLLIDENTIYYYVTMMTQEQDESLAAISSRFLNRQLLQYCPDPDGTLFQKLSTLIERYSPQLLPLCVRDEPMVQQPYQYYQQSETKMIVPIEFVLPNGQVVEISEISPIVRAISQEEFVGEPLLFYPYQQINELLQQHPEYQESLAVLLSEK
ncbi:MAG: HD domain-containing protein [Culicoidibacterales bacterium]